MSLGASVSASLRAAREKPARQRTERHEGDAQFAAGIEHRDLGVARPQRIFGLHRGDGMHRVRAAQRGADTSDRPMARTLPARTMPAMRADAVLDGHPLVPAVQVIEIDHVGLEPGEAFVAGAQERFRPAVDHALAVDVRSCRIC